MTGKSNPFGAFLDGLKADTKTEKPSALPKGMSEADMQEAARRVNEGPGVKKFDMKTEDGRNVEIQGVAFDRDTLWAETMKIVALLAKIFMTQKENPDAKTSLRLAEDMGFAHGVLTALAWISGDSTTLPVDIVQMVWSCEDPTCTCSQTQEQADKNRADIHARLRKLVRDGSGGAIDV